MLKDSQKGKPALERFLFETKAGEVVLTWLEARNLAIVKADWLGEQPAAFNVNGKGGQDGRPEVGESVSLVSNNASPGAHYSTQGRSVNVRS